MDMDRQVDRDIEIDTDRYSLDSIGQDRIGQGGRVATTITTTISTTKTSTTTTTTITTITTITSITTTYSYLLQ